MKKLWLAILALLIPGSLALAAVAYTADVVVTNNSSTAYTMLGANVSTNVNLLVTNGYITASGLDARVQSSGSDLPTMLASDRITFAVSVPTTSTNTYQLVTGQTALASMPIITGYGGYISIPDTVTEPSANSSQSMSGYLAISGTILSKDGAMVYTYDSATQNITGGFPVDYFASDYFTDVGAKIVVNNQRIEYESEASAVDTRTWRDVGVISDSYWHQSFAWYNTSGAGAGRTFAFGMWSNNTENLNAFTGDAILFVITDTSARIYRYDAGVGAASGAINFVDGTYYYVALGRESTTNATLSIYTDVAMTTHLAGSPISLAIPATIGSLRYIQGSNTANGAGAAIEQIGFIDNLFCTGLPIQGATKTGVTQGLHSIVFTDNTSSFGVQVDSGAFTTSNATTVPNNNARWDILAGATLPYTDNFSMYVGGNRQVYFAPITIITSPTLPDREATGGSNNGTITWGGNPTGVSVSLGSLTSTQVITANTSSSTYVGSFMPDNVTAPYNPTLVQAQTAVQNDWLYAFIKPFATISGTGGIWFYWFGVLCFAVAGFALAYKTKHLLIAAIAFDVPFGYGIAKGFIPDWVIIVLIIWTIGAVIQELRM